jgi:hypothetical protein
MRKIVIAAAVSLMVALMVAQPVSAEVLIVSVTDATGDVPYFWDSETGDAMTEPINGNQPCSREGYFDMTSYVLSKDSDTNMFTFEMTVAGDFPEPGDALPNGVQRVDWLIWFDRAPFNWVLSPEVTTVYQLNLTFDGMGYSCSFCEYVMLAGDVIETLDCNIEGTVFWTSFAGGLVGDIVDDSPVEFYWIVCIRVIHGTNSCNWADYTDWDAAEDQTWDSIWWPPQ